MDEWSRKEEEAGEFNITWTACGVVRSVLEHERGEGSPQPERDPPSPFSPEVLELMIDQHQQQHHQQQFYLHDDVPRR